MAAPRPKLHHEHLHGPTMTPAQVRELSDFRLGFVTLRDGTTPDAYYERLQSHIGNYQHVHLLRDDDGVLRGTFLLGVHRRTVPGGDYLWIHPEDLLLEKAYRGGGTYKEVMVEAVAPTLLEHGTIPKYLIADVFAASYVSLRQVAPEVWTLTDERLTGLARAAMEDVVMNELAVGTWDAERGGIRHLSIMSETAPTRFRQAADQAHFEEFERIIPMWAEGYSLPVMTELSAASLARGVKEAVRAELLRVLHGHTRHDHPDAGAAAPPNADTAADTASDTDTDTDTDR